MPNPKRISLFRLLSRTKSAAPHEPLPPLTKRIFALAFLSEFMVIYPFYVIMFGERGNVSAAGVGTLLAIWLVVSVAAEVPTGVIADKLSKKWSLVLGRIMQIATFAIWLFVPNFVGYLIGFIVWGIGEAFISGAYQAYLYESLDGLNKKAFGKIYARSGSFTMLAYTTGGFLAFLIGPEYPLLLALSILVSAAALWITLTLPATRSTVEVEMRPKILASALGAVRANPGLRRILVPAIIMLAVMVTLGEYIGQYYQQVGTPTRLVALFISLGSVTAAALYWWMHRIEAQMTRYQLPIILAFTALFALSFMGGTAVAVAGFFVFTRMLRMVTVQNETQIQHHAPDESRATLGSLYSFAGKLLSAGVIGMIGLFAVDNKIVEPLRWSVIIMVAIMTLSAFYFWLRKKATV